MPCQALQVQCQGLIWALTFQMSTSVLPDDFPDVTSVLPKWVLFSDSFWSLNDNSG